MGYIVSSKDIDQMVKGLKNHKENYLAMSRQITYQLADYHHKSILDRIPDRPEYTEYKKAIRLVGVGKDGDFFGIIVKGKNKPGDKIDASGSIIFVKPTRKLKKVNKGVKVLEEFSPWTLSTIPFMPPRSEALIVIRKVIEKDMKYVEKLRKRDKPKWRDSLVKVGVSIPNTPAKFDKTTGVVTDLYFLGMTLEFGLGDKKPTPHWRPALREIVTFKFTKPIKFPIMEAVSTGKPFAHLETWKNAGVPVVGEDSIHPNEYFFKRMVAYMGNS